MRTWVLAAGILSLCIVGQGADGAVVIDHASVAQVGSIPQEQINKAAAKLSIYFAHASVGTNICDGLVALYETDPVRYPLDVVHSSGTVVPDPLLPGRVYDNARGNPGWKVKVDSFKDQLAAGWGTKASVVINKFCYLDYDADFEYSIVGNANGTAMSQLEALYPGTVFVYTTMPLNAGGGTLNAARNEYNRQVRAWVQANNKVLFDIADIEAWDASGQETTYLLGGQTYQSLSWDYTSDGGHLNALGSQLAAQGFYALGAAIAPEPTMLVAGGTGAAAMLLVRRRAK